MFREGIPSAVAGFQGALHLHTKIPLKSKNKKKPNYNYPLTIN